MRNLKGLNNNDIFDQESRVYFPVVSIQKQSSCPKMFYNSFLNNFEKFMMKRMRQFFFVKVTSLTLLKMDSSTGVFLQILQRFEE